MAALFGLVYPLFDNVIAPLKFVLLDSKSFFTRNIIGKIVRSRQYKETGDMPQSTASAAVDCLLQRVLPSKRQSAEWDIRALKALSGILWIPLTAGATQRYLFMTVCVRLSNLRTRLVDPNEIPTVYANRSTGVQQWVRQFVDDSAQA